MAGQAALQTEIADSYEEQPPEPSTVALGSLALAPHSPDDKDIYDVPFFELTKQNFPGFYSYWYPFVHNVARRRMAPLERGQDAQEDAAQCVFEALVIHYMGTGKYLGLREEGSPRDLLVAMARNKTVDHFRGEVRNEKAELAAIRHLQTENPSAEDLALEGLMRKEDTDTVQSHLHKLTPEDQELIVRTNNGELQSELAKELGIEPGTLRLRVFRARKKLKGLMDGTLDETDLYKKPGKKGRPKTAGSNKAARPTPQPPEPAPIADLAPVFSHTDDAIDLDALTLSLKAAETAPPAPPITAPKKLVVAAKPPAVTKPVRATAKPPRVRKPAEKPIVVAEATPAPRELNLPTPDPNYVRETHVGWYAASFAAAGLKPEDIDILTWSDVDGSSAADLGDLLGKSKGTVEARLQQLRRQVRKFVEGKKTV